MNQLQHKQYTGKGGIAVGTALCLDHKNAFARFHHCSGVDGGTHDLAYRHRFSGEGGLVHHGFALQYHAVQRYRQHGDAETQALPHGKPLHDPEQNALRFVCRGKEAGTAEKQKQRFLSGTTIHEVHRLLGTAFQYAVEWGILVKSPVPVDSPKKSTQERTIWTVEELRAALDSMEGPTLHLAVHLTLVGALREGEIVGLTPEDIDFDAADGIGTFRADS